MRAITHSSLSNSFNNTDLARVGELVSDRCGRHEAVRRLILSQAGKAAVTEALFLDKDRKASGGELYLSFKYVVNV